MRFPLRILHIALSLELGGLETVIKNLCSRIDPSLFSMEVLCLNRYDPEYFRDLSGEGIAVHLLQKRNKFDFHYFLKVARFIRERRIDILHAHSGCFFYGSIFSILSRVNKFIFTAHGLPIFYNAKDKIEDNLASLICKNIIAVSEEVRDIWAHRIAFSCRKITIIHNGIDTKLFHPFVEFERKVKASDYGLPTDAFLIGSAGRLEPEKNYPMLLRAFAKINDEKDRPCAHLVLVGTGSCQKELERLSKDLGLANRVSFLGMQYRMHEIYPLFDIFVLSSFTEGTSLSLLEAQSCGVPAVVTDVGGNSFIVRHGENGYLCRLNDEETMAEAFRRLRDDHELFHRMGNSARERIINGLNLESMVRGYEEIYREISSNI